MIGVGLVAATLILTRSRAGWLAAGAALAVWLAALIASKALRQRAVLSRLTVIAVMLGVGVVAAVFVPNTLRWRSQNPYLDSMRGVANFQEGSGAGRLVQYRRSHGARDAEPVTGRRPRQLVGRISCRSGQARSIARHQRARHDIQSLAEQRLGCVHFGARLHARRFCWPWSSEFVRCAG